MRQGHLLERLRFGQGVADHNDLAVITSHVLLALVLAVGGKVPAELWVLVLQAGFDLAAREGVDRGHAKEKSLAPQPKILTALWNQPTNTSFSKYRTKKLGAHLFQDVITRWHRGDVPKWTFA